MMRAMAVMLVLIAGLLGGCRYFVGGPVERNLSPRTTPILLQEVPDRVLAAFVRLSPSLMLEKVEAQKLDNRVMAYRFHYRDARGDSKQLVLDPNGQVMTGRNGPGP